MVPMETVGGILGGIGVFLVGMILLTEGLRAAAGTALRGVLQRFARGPGIALVSGAGFTALVQSSSATTLTTIGFVSAGLLTFPQAVGVIFGANLGTTSTGWLVSLIGFRVNVAAMALPLVGVGALLRLLSRGRRAQLGLAMAGFGLIFVGIEILQVGMEGLAERVDPSTFPGPTLGGRVVLVVLGVVMTVVMQSSSAAVATTLTALNAGTVGVEQAAFLVVGQNVGTTVKAALASIGGSVPVRRTALAHILFNFITGLLALLLLPILLGVSLRLVGGDPSVGIALFHSSFNLLGVLVLFPVIGGFSRVVERMVPELEPTLTRHLDPAVAQIPPVAVEAARRSAASVSHLLFRRCEVLLRPGASARAAEASDPVLGSAGEALREIRSFLGNVRTSPEDPDGYDRHLSVLHAVDHLDRFVKGMAGLGEVGWLPVGAEVKARGSELSAALTAGGLDELQLPDVERLGRLSTELAELRRRERARVLASTASGATPPEDAWGEIEAVKRLDRLGYHAWRIAHHLKQAEVDGTPAEVAQTGTEEGLEDRWED